VLAGSACLCAELSLDMMARAEPPWLWAGLLAGAGLAAAVLVRRHLHRAKQPLIDPAPWSVPTFRLVMLTGTCMRGLISSMPFLLPLLFQLGFGYDPFHAGLLVLGLFAGNVGIKPITSWVLRRWGFRTVIAANAVLQAGTMLGCAAIGPWTPSVLIWALLIVSGASRSLQFTAFATLAFADVPQERMAPANTWFSVAQQFGNGVGVAAGALVLRVAGSVVGGPELAGFAWTFTALAGAMLVLAGFGLRLRPEAGAAVSGHRPATVRA
jgi:hypothetical protein